MSVTKRQIVDDAIAELGIGVDEDVGSDGRQGVLRRLDMMMASWERLGVRLGYTFPATLGESDMDDESGLPDGAVEAAALNLAIRCAPGLGKTVSVETKAAARAGYDTLLRDSLTAVRQQLPDTLPRGAGNKGWRTRGEFMPSPEIDPLDTDSGGDLTISE